MKTSKILSSIADKWILPNKHIQDYFNHRYNRDGYYAVDKGWVKDCYYKFNGFEFVITDQLLTVQQVVEDYDFSDIFPTDIFLDLGSNCGTAAMFASRKTASRNIFAVEPIYGEIIKQNLKRNNLTDITLFEIALGIGKNHGRHVLNHNGVKKEVVFYLLSEIIEMCGGKVDFLKMDYDGNEGYDILPQELDGIRRIEAEIHNFKKYNIAKFLITLNQAGFTYTYAPFETGHIIVHAVNKSIENQPLACDYELRNYESQTK